MFRGREKPGALIGRSQSLAGGDVTNLGDDSATQLFFFFTTHTAAIVGASKGEAEGGLFSILVSSLTSLFLSFVHVELIAYSCAPLPKMTRVTFAEFWTFENQVETLFRLLEKERSVKLSALALIYSVHDSVSSVTNLTTGTKWCRCVFFPWSDTIPLSGNRFPRRFQITSHAARLLKVLLSSTDSSLESLLPSSFMCTAADSSQRLTPSLFQQEGRAMKTLRAAGALNKPLRCRRDLTSS